MYHPSMKAKMDELEARKVSLSAGLEETPEPPAFRLHPRLTDLYREKIAGLSSALSDPSVKVEATEALRGLMLEIRMISDTQARGGHRMELVGELAAILSLLEGPTPDITKPPLMARAGVDHVRSVTMVAGVGFEPTTFRL